MYNLTHNIEHGVVEILRPGIRRITAANVGPYTFKGTGTYIIGDGEVAIIDPGPFIPAHIDALMEALKHETISHILITHTHADHSPACQLVQQHCNAKSYAFDPTLNTKDFYGLENELLFDTEFTPDVVVEHGEFISGSNWQVECIHTPGHMFNHLSFALTGTENLFCGDQVMAWSSSIISPPEGNLNDYMNSLRLLLARPEKTYWPTHGPAIENPEPLIKELLRHREERVEQVFSSIAQGLHSIPKILEHVYHDLQAELHLAAARSIFASIIYLIEQGRVQTDGLIRLNAQYRAAQ